MSFANMVIKYKMTVEDTTDHEGYKTATFHPSVTEAEVWAVGDAWAANLEIQSPSLDFVVRVWEVQADQELTHP
jgi:hypothetical protein